MGPTPATPSEKATTQKSPSPSPSTLFLPLGLRSRRASRSSLTQSVQLDRESLSQALDQIHTTASRSETLTTFNDYSSPPPASSSNDSKNASIEAASTGLSGLYSRFRGAVGTSKDKSSQDVTGAGLQKGADKIHPGPVDNAKLTAEDSELSTSNPSASTQSEGPPQKDQRTRTKSLAALPPILTTSNSIPAPIDQSPRLAGVQKQPPEGRKGSGVGSADLDSLSRFSDMGKPRRNSTKQTSSTYADSDSSQASELLMKIRSKQEQETAMVRSPTGTSEDFSKSRRPLDGSLDSTDNLTIAQSFHKHDSGNAAKVPHGRPDTSGYVISGKRSKEASAATSVSPAYNATSQSHLPGFRLSRASSTDTGFSSIPDYQESYATSPTLSQARYGGILHQAIGRPLLKVSTDGTKASADTLQEFRTRVLSKDFWMKDENSKECFRCGTAFTTWRRKHHCRTCGQIFDAKCTALIDGKVFGQSGSLRVCKPCQTLIQGAQDGSEGSFSEDDDVYMFPVPNLKRDLPDSTQSSTDSRFIPTMAIPTRRLGDASDRRSAILGINPEDYSNRPTSSRSIRTPLTGRPRSSSHRRHTRQQLSRSSKMASEDRAPFIRTTSDDILSGPRLSAYHNDSIIDPDLAPYMSDEGPSSDDEEMSIFGAIESTYNGNSADPERQALANAFNNSKRGRSRLNDKTFSGLSVNGREFDDGSITSSRLHRMPRKRNTSFATLPHQRPTPRRSKSNLLLKGLGSGISEVLGTSPASTQNTGSPHVSGFRATRSASMRGATAPAIELNSASLDHVRKLLRQLLQDAGIVDVSGWEKSLIPILLRCTDDVSPDIRAGDDIDIRHYVKIKKIPGGKLGDTAYISGVVFGKNVALKSMPRSITYPTIILIRSAIEYQRSQHHFMSLEPVIAQEKEALRNKVNRIQEFQPTLLLVQDNVSGVALDYLDKAGIATVHNIKQSVIEAVGRCCRADINSSIEMLTLNQRPVGQSASFDIKTYVHKDIPGRKRTYIYLSGCAKELGCTIVLRGADVATLSKVKRITEFMVYVVYNLKLETCLMRDEYVSIPTIADIKAAEEKSRNKITRPDIERLHASHSKPNTSQAPKQLVNGPAEVDGSSEPKTGVSMVHSEKEGLISATPEALEQRKTLPGDENTVPDDIPMPTFYSDMVEKHETKILSASPFVKFMQPYLLMRAREQERRLVYLKRLKDQDNSDGRLEEKEAPQKFFLITPEMVHQLVKDAPRKVTEVLHAVHDAEWDKAMYNYETQKRRWETYIAGNVNLFDPFAHQNIVVLFTLICTSTTVPCIGPQILALRFYDEHESEMGDIFEADCTLGQFVESSCLGARDLCSENGCEKPMSQHHRQYVCGEGQISVSVEHHPCKLRGLQDSILMWSWCQICKKDTQVMPMSENTWNYSFGKYLELSFWSSDLRLRANVCPHNLYRDHDRFFGFKDMAVRVQYTKIELLEVVVPRARITWKVELDLKIKNDVYTQIEERLNKFMASVKARLKSININSVLPEKIEGCKAAMEQLTKRANDEHQSLLKNLQDKYMGSKYYETTPLNRVVRFLQEKTIEWDTAFANFEIDFFPSERDIRRLAALQLKKIFLDRDESITTPILDTPDGGESLEASLNEKSGQSGAIEIAPRPTQMSAEEARDVLTSVVEEQNALCTDENLENKEAPQTTSPHPSKSDSLTSDGRSIDAIEHLDLAVSPASPGKSQSQNPVRDVRPISPLNLKEIKPSKPSSPRAGSPSMLPRRESKDRQIQGSDENHSISGPNTPGIPGNAPVGPRRQSPLVPPLLSRAQSQPTPAHVPRERQAGNLRNGAPLSATTTGDTVPKKPGDLSKSSTSDLPHVGEKKISERLGLGALKNSRKSGHSLIPRPGGKRKESKVSTLAKHFEQLSREFEKERLRERRRAFLTRQSRAYPTASSKPIVEVYRNVKDAVGDRDQSDDEAEIVDHRTPRSSTSAVGRAEDGKPEQKNAPPSVQEDDLDNVTQAEDTTADNTEAEEMTRSASVINSDAEGEASDIEHSFFEDIQIPNPLDISNTISPLDSPLDLKIDFPKHEKSSLMKMLTNFWAERSASGWTPLDYPLSPTDHVFADSNVMIREDEPSSVIALALDCHDYRTNLENFAAQNSSGKTDDNSASWTDSDAQTQIEKTLHRKTDTHFSCGFKEGSATMFCKIFFAEQFDAVRKTCGVADRIVESLTRCLKWDSKGGKSKSVFLKTLDDRFVLKSLQTAETQAFLKFAPAYFQIMSKVFFQELPSAIAKMLGFFQVIIKNPLTGTDIKWDLLLMENLFYDRVPSRTFDLKGSMRNRKIQPTGEQNEVLLDENMVDLIFEKPLFSREHSKKLLAQSVFNDTMFLARQQVMDYSLMVAIDDSRKELVVGIIDCIRTYTWDKKVEFWIKDRGFGGGGTRAPTVTSPKEYKSRFREAMARYVLHAPNCWHQFSQQIDAKKPVLTSKQLESARRETAKPVALPAQPARNVS
ncbi:MAG: 1-phosphatidylinositol-3-phosphate 5-kinase [Vezdaea aestivalis]|nr:MAG: 1-phosphatidylinositol-3-phosphate 5-kinase [Vezdaea aestivalis]